MNYSGKLITLEGVEGAGKSSIIPKIIDHITQAGKKVISTREPGGTTIAENIRELVLSADVEEKIDPITETLLMWAARRQHLVNHILPKLKEGYWVVCDRFTDSSLAYQHYGRGVSLEFIERLKKETILNIEPDKTLLFLIEPSIGLNRISKNRVKFDRIENEKLDFFNRVSDGYKEIAKNNCKRVAVIYSNQDIKKVTANAIQQIDELL